MLDYSFDYFAHCVLSDLLFERQNYVVEEQPCKVTAVGRVLRVFVELDFD
jgi:hypothetical protein